MSVAHEERKKIVCAVAQVQQLVRILAALCLRVLVLLMNVRLCVIKMRVHDVKY